MENVILVDKNDNQIGVEEKIKAHKEAKLHRAISIFIFNSKNELMLQKRAKNKYHCGGLWSNTVCSHPNPDETVEEAVHRRLNQEMGFDCDMKEIFSFIYTIKFDNGLTENEFDHVFIGKYEKNPVLNREEAGGFKWITIDELKKEINKNPEKYTYWMKQILDRVDNESNKI